MEKTKKMKDTMGTVEVPANSLYGAQTQRAVNNFPISGQTMAPEFIQALALIKSAAAEANGTLGLLPKQIANAISKAALEVAAGQHTKHFPVDIFQTGSGTSTNMNMNEVIATLASSKIRSTVKPNDHVNMGQSSNDVIPTAIHVAAAVQIQWRLIPVLRKMAKAMETKCGHLNRYVKTGRTHLMDAMPVTMAQEMSGWEAQISKGVARLESSLPRLCMLAQGGSAVGSGVNVHPRFPGMVARKIKARTKVHFRVNANFFESLSCQDAAVEMSGQLKTVAVSLMKIANDLRWMNSGPLAGLSEVELIALQPGSSIMPGKVNPVIPEACAMVCAQVIGNDTAITVAGQSGSFQLNVMLPLVARNLLESISLLAGVVPLMTTKVIRPLKPKRKNLEKTLARNPILVTALNPVIGYEAAAEIAKEAYRKRQPVIDVAEKMTDIPRARLEKLLNPAKLTKGGLI